MVVNRNAKIEIFLKWNRIIRTNKQGTDTEEISSCQNKLSLSPATNIINMKKIISAIGANLIEMTAGEHDRILASTSHLPFLISSALTYSMPQEFASLVGPGFRSTSRLAGTPSHMMIGILRSNRDNILDAIRIFRNSLDNIESALLNENYAELENILNQSRTSYQLMVE